MLWGIVWIVLFSPFSWQWQKLSLLSLEFITDWRVTFILVVKRSKRQIVRFWKEGPFSYQIFWWIYFGHTVCVGYTLDTLVCVSRIDDPNFYPRSKWRTSVRCPSFVAPFFLWGSEYRCPFFYYDTKGCYVATAAGTTHRCHAVLYFQVQYQAWAIAKKLIYEFCRPWRAGHFFY